MELDCVYDRITSDELTRLATVEYTKRVTPDIAALDKKRTRLAEQIMKQRKAEGNAYIEKEELVQMVEWKLKHGKFRPNLLNLAKSNDEAAVRDISAAAFKMLDESGRVAALEHITKLKGVGPATASLLLSVYDPTSTPFFSDELFRWVHMGAEDVESGKAERTWQRKIKYNKSEYQALCEKVEAMRRRLDDVTATQLEAAAYALGRPAVESSTKRKAEEASSDPSSTKRNARRRKA